MRGSDRLLAVSVCVTGLSLLLMLWAGAVGAADTAGPPPPPPPPDARSAEQEGEPGGGDRRRSLLSGRHWYPPCHFSPLCTCSNAGPDLGLVFCMRVRLLDVPAAINTSKVFALTMRENGLGQLSEDQFFMTRLWRLAVQKNELRAVPERAFSGLERSLWELDLSGNQLWRLPHQALRRLSSLRLLDVSGNQISTLRRSDLQGLEKNLETLLLAHNNIRQLPTGLVGGLASLRQVNLASNVLTGLPAGCLAGAPRLAELNLAQNLLHEVPFAALDGTSVHTVLLPGNVVNDTINGTFNGQLRLQFLDLSENRITRLPVGAWRRFSRLDKLLLRGNQLDHVDEAAFEDVPIQELFMHDCWLRTLPNGTLIPLADSLRVLDLGYNRLDEFPWESLPALTELRSLALNDNRLATVPAEPLGQLTKLRQLNLLGAAMGAMNVSALDLQVRSVGLSVLSGSRLTGELTDGIGRSVQRLYLGKNGLDAIGEDAFSRCPTLKELDLSHNRIAEIDERSFQKLGPILEQLVLFDGFAASEFPADALRYLTSLKTLDLSGNKINSVPTRAFESMKNLRRLSLQHNKIAKIEEATFRDQNNPSIESIHLAFNHIKVIQKDTFRKLDSLESIELSDNAVSSIAAGAFSNLDKVRSVTMENNRISALPDRAFSSLPRASRVSLAHNQLTSLNLDAFDQVGTLASLQLDVSHNSIAVLDMEKEYWSSFTSFEYINLSHNNISRMTGRFFETMRSSLTHASLAHNNITNITRDVFGFMPYIQLLDVSFNRIDNVDYDAFQNAVNLQIVNMSHNSLTELPSELFQNLMHLRTLDVSHNRLQELPRNIFRRSTLQIFNAAHNSIADFPGDCLSRVGGSLRELDLSHNRIAVLNDDLLHRLDQLTRLDLSDNRVVTVQEGAFRSLRRLHRLDLSGNPLGDLAATVALRDLSGLRRLRLANTSLTRFPALSTHTLHDVDVGHNGIVALRADSFANLTRLRRLQLAYNRITQVDRTVWSMLSDLRTLGLAGNPFRNVSQLSFHGLDKLNDLDLADIATDNMQPELLEPLDSLTTLRLSVRGAEPAGRLAALLRRRPSLRHLNLKLNGSLGGQLHGRLGHQLCNVTISGPDAVGLTAAALKDLTCHHIHVAVRGAAVGFRLPAAVFRSLGGAVRYVTLRLETAAAVGRPSTTAYPGEAGSVYLTDLRLGGRGWTCDCSDDGIGWVEEWLSQWRHYFCPDIEADERCQATVSSLRQAQCSTGKSVLSALSSDLECRGAGSAYAGTTLLIVAAVCFVCSTAIY